MDRQKFALCIGQNKYAHCEPLDKAINDSRAMRNLLQSLGFIVLSADDTSKRDMKKTIKEFHQSLTPNCLALFFFSGYSMQQDGQNYLVPIDADVGSAADIDEDCVSVNWVVRGLTECEGSISTVLLEAARGNPFEHKWPAQVRARASFKGLASMRPPPGVLIAFSAEPGSTISYEYTLEDNAVFTSSLLQHIAANPSSSVETILRQTRASVEEATEGQQRVWAQSRMVDDFYFHRTRAISPTPRAASPQFDSTRSGSPTALPSISSPRKSPERLRSRSPQRAYTPKSRRTHAWTFAHCAHPEGWLDAAIDNSTPLPICNHPNSTEDSNCVVALAPTLYSGVHHIRLQFRRGPVETESAHSVELVSADATYSNESPSLTFELPNVMNCEAEFTVDFVRDTMSMKANDGQPPVSLPISDLRTVGVHPPYKLVVYLWDAASTVEILSSPSSYH